MLWLMDGVRRSTVKAAYTEEISSRTMMTTTGFSGHPAKRDIYLICKAVE